jgi:hypothetical protein
LPWHPCPPPSSPSPLPSSLPLPLLASQPCQRLHHLAALTLLVACHPHRHHSRCRRHPPCCCSPRTLVAIAIALATITSVIVIACHPRRHCNRPLHCLCLHLPTTLVASRRHPACRQTVVAAVAAAAGYQPWRWRGC